ncbi:uncharacterized protein IL334_004345 [Kwoniella shivajii]|uniref:MADS-box domain-containing protein n=1 Tax=Kwoniella shivajii TaxID=564305 RepID=A0ABZ1D026_9TREE|nr:hypothetical protein IL334_004345 [Kwoniella shivajii]
MGRKKIEIRPLTDERNRNVTFLKRKAGLMKKAWELSVLCAADVNIIIFSAVGKAYEFSSKELDQELDRYMDYEGMIERRRAPEFAAMALADEDEEDEYDDDENTKRRGSTSKAGANNNNNINGVNGTTAQPRSLKGKESFKSRTPRYSQTTTTDKDRNKNKRSGSSGKSKRRKERRSERSESEKRSFIDSILSGSDDDDENNNNHNNSSDYSTENDDTNKKKKRSKDKHHHRDRERREDERYYNSDKNVAGLHYAMNLHTGYPNPNNPSSSADPRYLSNLSIPSSSSRDRDIYDREIRSNNIINNNNSAIPIDIPQLPKLPSDGASYRSQMTSGLNNSYGPNQSQSQSHSHSQGLGPGPGSGPSNYESNSTPFIYSNHPQSYLQHQQTHLGSAEIPGPGHPYGVSEQSYRSTLQQSPLGHLPMQSSQSTLALGPSGSSIIPPGVGGIQWDQSLVTRYAEFQLQQNHQRQQRLLLERQRHQLQQMGVPVDERSLLDEIFGGMMSNNNNHHSNSHNQNHNSAATPIPINSASATEMILPLNDDTPNGGGAGDFVWPLSSSNDNGGREDESQSQHTYNGNGNGLPQQPSGGNIRIPDDTVQWGVQDGYEVDRDGLNLPSPVSNDNGPSDNKRKSRRDEDEINKRMRL